MTSGPPCLLQLLSDAEASALIEELRVPLDGSRWPRLQLTNKLLENVVDGAASVVAVPGKPKGLIETVCHYVLLKRKQYRHKPPLQSSSFNSSSLFQQIKLMGRHLTVVLFGTSLCCTVSRWQMCV